MEEERNAREEGGIEMKWDMGSREGKSECVYNYEQSMKDLLYT